LFARIGVFGGSVFKLQKSSDYLPYSKPLSIPNHPGNMSPGTAGNILAILEQDLFEIEDMLEEQSRGAK
jgi:hypothetical protein